MAVSQLKEMVMIDADDKNQSAGTETEIENQDEGANAPDDEDDLLPNLDDDDEAGEDDEDDEDEDDVDPAAAGASQDANGKQPSRRTIRVQKLEKERDAERTRAAELQARLDGILSGRTTQQSDDARRAEEARVAAMDPLERKDYEQQRKIDALQAQVSNLGFAQADGLDRARFEAKAELDPVYKKYAADVEKTLQEMRAKGVNTTREALLTYKLGEAMRKKLEAGKPNAAKRKAAAEGRVNASKGKPANMRGDSSGTGKGKTEEDRLRGVQI